LNLYLIKFIFTLYIAISGTLTYWRRGWDPIIAWDLVELVGSCAEVSYRSAWGFSRACPGLYFPLCACMV